MASLSEQSCSDCATKGGSPAALEEDIVAKYLALLCPLWTITNSPSNDDGKALSKSFVTRNFASALDYLNRAGAVAEAQGHHPDLHITRYRTVKVVVYTHSTGGLCLNDFILASRFDLLEIVGIICSLTLTQLLLTHYSILTFHSFVFTYTLSFYLYLFIVILFIVNTD
jgi:4a-hydroxytetrahydrobiopterin dehydratase